MKSLKTIALNICLMATLLVVPQASKAETSLADRILAGVVGAGPTALTTVPHEISAADRGLMGLAGIGAITIAGAAGLICMQVTKNLANEMDKPTSKRSSLLATIAKFIAQAGSTFTAVCFTTLATLLISEAIVPGDPTIVTLSPSESC